MIGAGIDPEMTHHRAAERPTRDHTFDRLLDDPLGMLAIEDRALTASLDAARIAGVPVEDALRALVAGELHLFGVDDDDVVAAIHVRGVAGLVLAAQAHRDDRGEPA